MSGLVSIMLRVILIKIFNFSWLIYIWVCVEFRGFSLASPQAIIFISEMLIIDWSISQCDVTSDSRIRMCLNRDITHINQFDINFKMLDVLSLSFNALFYLSVQVKVMCH